ncbi:MAG: hypothetical protein ACYC99_08815 [Candidatus Geothermincolia bacterium]
MNQDASAKRQNRFIEFVASPFRGKYPPPLTHIGDYFAVAGVVFFVISVFFLKWINVGIKDVFGLGKAIGMNAPQKQYGLFVSPWAWVMVGVLVALVLGIYFVQTRGGLTLGIGIFCLMFNVVFYIGAWQKINAIIGNVVDLVKAIPFVGDMLGQAVSSLAKSLLSVHVAAGYWLFIPAGLLLVVGGALRIASKPRMLSEGVAP